VADAFDVGVAHAEHGQIRQAATVTVVTAE
jgi:hypothetical protein